MELTSMPISQKIIDRVNAVSRTPEERQLMMDILKIEDKGNFRFDAEYEGKIKEYLAAIEKEVHDA